MQLFKSEGIFFAFSLDVRKVFLWQNVKVLIKMYYLLERNHDIKGVTKKTHKVKIFNYFNYFNDKFED